MPQATELLEYWGECPPTHILLKAFMGWGRERARPAEQCTDAELDAFFGELARVGGHGGIGDEPSKSEQS